MTRRPETSHFPTRLSQTGLFADVKDQTPMAGVLPFAVNCRQWQDGATAEHWVAFPGESSATLYTEAKPIPGMVDWHSFRMQFPKDAVLVKSISLAGRGWRRNCCITMAWTGTPTRMPGATTRPMPTWSRPMAPRRRSSDGKRKRVWSFHSRSQCMSCHSTWSEFALAFRPEQLNRPGPDGRNQLVALTEAGLIRRAEKDGKALPPFDAGSAARERRLADPADVSQPLEARARAYLHTNCGHCHVDGGGGSVDLRLQFSVANAEMKAIGVRPTRGDFALPDAAHHQAGRSRGRAPCTSAWRSSAAIGCRTSAPNDRTRRAWT